MNRMACIVVSGFQECFSAVLSAAVNNTRGNVANGSGERFDHHEWPKQVIQVLTWFNWFKGLSNMETRNSISKRRNLKGQST